MNEEGRNVFFSKYQKKSKEHDVPYYSGEKNHGRLLYSVSYASDTLIRLLLH
jgi:hypothetical protein